MDCKRALKENNGDLEKAVEYLREKGLASAAKKAGRVAADGSVGSFVNADRTNGALVEVNCETDFVAKTEDFNRFVQELAEHITQHAPKAVSSDDEGAQAPYLLDQPFKGQQTVGEYVTELVAKTGEKVTIRRFAHYQTDENGFVQEYIHMNGKIGVLIELAVSDSSLKAREESGDFSEGSGDAGCCGQTRFYPPCRRAGVVDRSGEKDLYCPGDERR